VAGRPSPTGSFGPDTKRHHPQEMAWVAFVTHEMIETDAPSSISSLTLPLATKGGHRSHAYALDEPAIVSGGRLNAHACVPARVFARIAASPRDGGSRTYCHVGTNRAREWTIGSPQVPGQRGHHAGPVAARSGRSRRGPRPIDSENSQNMVSPNLSGFSAFFFAEGRPSHFGFPV
jgi:hypothetical protein